MSIKVLAESQESIHPLLLSDIHKYQIIFSFVLVEQKLACFPSNI